MQANRPANPYQFIGTHRNIQSGLEPLTIKAGMIMAIETKQENNVYDGDMQEPSDICLISCVVGALRQFKQEKRLEITLTDANSHLKD